MTRPGGRRRLPRAVPMGLLLVSVALAVWSGTLVRHHVQGPDPVATARAATAAYSSGDCAALRVLLEDPAAVACSEVDAVQAAYRSEGLRSGDFAYELVSRSGDVATVRVTSVGGTATLSELIAMERHDGEWRIVVDPPAS